MATVKSWNYGARDPQMNHKQMKEEGFRNRNACFISVLQEYVCFYLLCSIANSCGDILPFAQPHNHIPDDDDDDDLEEVDHEAGSSSAGIIRMEKVLQAGRILATTMQSILAAQNLTYSRI